MGELEKSKYQEIAKEMKSLSSVQDLDKHQRETLVKRHQKQLVEEVSNFLNSI